MSAYVVSTDARGISTKVNWFVDTIKAAIADGRLHRFSTSNATIVLDMIPATDVSKKCDYAMSRRVSTYEFETMPVDWNPSCIWSIEPQLRHQVDDGRAAKVGQNYVCRHVRRYVEDQVGDGVRRRSRYKTNIVFTDVALARHISRAKMIFDILHDAVFMNTLVQHALSLAALR